MDCSGCRSLPAPTTERRVGALAAIVGKNGGGVLTAEEEGAICRAEEMDGQELRG